MTTLLIGAALGLLAWLTYRSLPHAVALLLFLLPAYRFRLEIVGIPTNIFELAVSVVAVIVILRPAKLRTTLARIPRTVTVWLGLFIVATVLSTLISSEMRVSLGILKGWIGIPLLCMALVWHTTSLYPRAVNLFTWSLIISGVVMALLGLSQLGELTRVRGLYDVPNSLALALAPLFWITIWPALQTTQHRRLRRIFGTVQGIALLATGSVGGLVATLVAGALGVFLWLSGPAQRRALMTLVSIALLGLIITTFSGKLWYLTAPLMNDTAHSSLTVRQQLWSVSLELIRQHPIVGIGLGQFEPHYQRVLHERFRVYEEKCGAAPLRPGYAGRTAVGCAHPPQFEFVHRDPHNWLLSFWLNTGLLGLVSFIGLHVVIGQRVYRAGVKNASCTTEALTLALIALLLFGLSDAIFWKNDLAALQLILLVLLLQSGARYQG